MKENGEAGEEDEASAQLAFFLSAQTLTPAGLFSLTFHLGFSLVASVLLQTWPVLPVSLFSIGGSGTGDSSAGMLVGRTLDDRKYQEKSRGSDVEADSRGLS